VRTFEPDTPTKLAMIGAIQKSIARILPFSRYAARLPERVRIAIANFNVDDGHTYVVVRETNQLYGVLLDTGSADVPAGGYLVWQESSDVAKIRSKVIATGIEREIPVRK
jgi:hypothetical protein